MFYYKPSPLQEPPEFNEMQYRIVACGSDVKIVVGLGQHLIMVTMFSGIFLVACLCSVATL